MGISESRITGLDNGGTPAAIYRSHSTPIIVLEVLFPGRKAVSFESFVPRSLEVMQPALPWTPQQNIQLRTLKYVP